MEKEKVIIIGGGPCGLSAAIALQNKGIEPLVIEKGNVVNAIYHYPTHQTFFSTSEKLAIGDVPFIIEGRKPVRNQALSYYREVVRLKKLRINAYETVMEVAKKEGSFYVKTRCENGHEKEYAASYIIVATGYYDHPNYLDIPGESLPKVKHYFKEGHPYFNKDVVVIGGKNSSIDAALELEKAGARVTVLYRGTGYSPSVKPWILPEFDGLVRDGNIKIVFESYVKEITEESVVYVAREEEYRLKNDFVFAMIGYHPDHTFLTKMGIEIHQESGKPVHDVETLETNVERIFIAGVIAAGNNANEIFIENGRFHGGKIADRIEEIAKKSFR